MADLVITAANVKKGSNAKVETGIAGETITAGQNVYQAAATQKLFKSDADSATAEVRTVIGIALHAASADQPLTYIKSGQVTIGAALTVGSAFFLSATAGGICPHADLATGMFPTFLGWAISATVLDVNIVSAGVAKP
jgi:hypothetical protein